MVEEMTLDELKQVTINYYITQTSHTVLVC